MFLFVFTRLPITRHTDHSPISDLKVQIKCFTWDQNGRQLHGGEKEIGVLDVIPVPERLWSKIKVNNRQPLTLQWQSHSSMLFLRELKYLFKKIRHHESAAPYVFLPTQLVLTCTGLLSCEWHSCTFHLSIYLFWRLACLSRELESQLSIQYVKDAGVLMVPSRWGIWGSQYPFVVVWMNMAHRK